MDSKSQKLVSAADVARLYGVTERSIGNWVSAGQIPSHQIGSVRRFNVQEVLESTRRPKSDQ